MADYKVVSRRVFDPVRSFFKQPANSRAECSTIRCQLDKCPLRDVGSCTYSPILGWDACPYGKFSKENGPTKRARSVHKWVADKKAEFPDAPRLGSPPRKLAFIGDYVYLPYAHMTNNEEVPFLGESGALKKGRAFLPRSGWTIDTVLSLLDFLPQALFGGEIKSYQEKEVPKFRDHLRELDPGMWQQLVEKRPDYDTTPDHVGRTALLRTLNSPIEWETKHDRYRVRWKWDGSTLFTTSANAYDSTWGKIELESVEIRGVPAADATLKIQYNAWVNEGTQFTD
jgi:hypothetical protein